MHPTGHALPDDSFETANDRMKRRAAQWWPRSLVLAVLLHFALFSLSPTMRAAAFPTPGADELIVIPDQLDIPPPPEQIARPAAPVAGSLDVPDDVTIAPMTLDRWTPDLLPPPARPDERAREGFERFVPSMVAPRLLNPEEVERELLRTYPSVLRDAGIGGDVDVNLWLDETGRIVRAEIARPSGYGLLDEAALKVVGVMRLAPAQNRGNPARVIVTLPVRFVVR